MELRWDHLLFSHKWRVMTFIQPDSAPKGVTLLVNTGVAGGDTRPKIRTVFTAKALVPPENRWFPPSPSSSSQHQALAHCQLTASSGETSLSFLGCFQIRSNHVPSPDRILWMKNSLTGQEWMYQISSYFLRILKLSACSTILLVYLWSQAGFRHRALQRWVTKDCSSNMMEEGDGQGIYKYGRWLVILSSPFFPTPTLACSDQGRFSSHPWDNKIHIRPCSQEALNQTD